MGRDVEVVSFVVSVERGFSANLDAHEGFLVVGDVAVGGFETDRFLRFVGVRNVVVFGIFDLDPPRHLLEPLNRNRRERVVSNGWRLKKVLFELEKER